MRSVGKDDEARVSQTHTPETEKVRLTDDRIIRSVTDVWGLPDDPEAETDGSIISLLKRLRPSDFVLFNILPTWGPTLLRNVIAVSGSGVVELDGGALRVASGTTSGSTASLRTRERGQYRSGSEAEAGLGLRIPAAPTGTAVVRWGYFDENNGLGYGLDAGGLFLFRRTGGTDTVYRQADWNQDTLDGSGDANNPSGLTLDTSDGNIHQIRFWWYGHGPNRWITEVPNASRDRRIRVLLHRLTYIGELSIEDPNQPITVEVDNGDTTDDIEAYVGGRQYGIRARTLRQDRRSPEAIITDYAVSTDVDAWQPLLVARLKTEYPAGSGRANSVRCVLRGAKIAVNARVEIRLTGLDEVTADSAAGWVNPEGVSDKEAAVEVQVQDGNLQVQDDGSNYQFSQDTVAGNVNDIATLSTEEEFVLGVDDTVTLWVRRKTNNSTTVQSAALELDEQR